MMVQRGRDIAMPELIAEAQKDSQIEHDVNIGPGLAARRDDCGAELHQLAGILIKPEANPQPFPLPGASNRKHDIGVGGGRRQIEIGLDMEFEPTQRLGAARRIGVRQQ